MTKWKNKSTQIYSKGFISKKSTNKSIWIKIKNNKLWRSKNKKRN